MKKYRTGSYGKDLICEVEVVRETEKQVIIMGHTGDRREAKKSEYQNYFDTWEEAKEFLIIIAQNKVDDTEIKLENAKDKLGIIRGLRQGL